MFKTTVRMELVANICMVIDPLIIDPEPVP